MRTPRLLWQVFLVHLAILVVLIAGLEWYASRSAREFYTDRKQAELETIAKVSEARLLALLDRQAFDELRASARTWRRPVSLRITVILPSGQVVADTSENPQQMDNHADRPEVKSALRGEVGRSTRFSRTVGEQLTYVAVPLRQDGQVAGVVRTAFPVQSLSDTIRAVYVRIALVGLAAAVLAGLVSLLVARKITQPLETLRQGAERFAR